MPDKIQRVARALNSLLSQQGGQTPLALNDNLQGTIDLLQFYGMTQYARVDVANAAAAEGTVLELVVPANQLWVLFAMHAVVVKTATMTACRISLAWGEAGSPMVVWAEALGPFGATETGTITSGLQLPYPKILLPGMNCRGRIDIIGTDATADFTFSAGIGRLG